jgi:hypothetical protein
MSDFDYSFPFTWFRSPLSGDVIQNISPEFTKVDIAGNANIERRIVREVASYGDQLGTMLDVLALLAKDLDQDSKAVTELNELKAKVDAVKQQEKSSAEARARDALESLRKADKGAFAKLIGELKS